MTKLIPLSKTGKKNAGKYFAVVDDGDVDRSDQHSWTCWFSKGKEYAASKIDGRIVLLHRFLLNAPAHLRVDHIDGNGLNCTRQNMRFATQSQNSKNRKKKGAASYKGIYPYGNKWGAQICSNYHHIYLGLFATPEDAAHAYDTAALKYFGEFARLNFTPAITPKQ
jgi:hypothetical protein